MNPDTEISELARKCEENCVQLPENSWQALREIIAALRHTQKDDLGDVQTTKALDELMRKFGDSSGSKEVIPMVSSPRVVRRQKRMLLQDLPKNKRRSVVVSSKTSNVRSSVGSSKKKKGTRKSRIQEEVEATPALRDENQVLVDQLVRLGQYEMHHGYSQRGTSRMRAAKAICNSNMAITSGAQAKQLDNVGPAVAAKIDQIVNEGLTAALSEYE